VAAVSDSASMSAAVNDGAAKVRAIDDFLSKVIGVVMSYPFSRSLVGSAHCALGNVRCRFSHSLQRRVAVARATSGRLLP